MFVHFYGRETPASSLNNILTKFKVLLETFGTIGYIFVQDWYGFEIKSYTASFSAWYAVLSIDWF